MLFLGLSLSTSAQSAVDSIRNVIQSNIADSIKVGAINELAYILRRSNTEEALKLSKRAIKIAEQNQLYEQLVIGKKNLGLAFNYSTNSSEALKTYLEGLKLCDAHQLFDLKSGILMNIGNVYLRRREREKARDYYQKSLSVAEQIQSLSQKAKALGSLGNLAKDREEARYYFNKALAIHKELKDERNISITYTNLSRTYFETDISKAIELNHKALIIDKRRKDLYGMSYSYSNLGQLYRKKFNYDSSLYYLKQAESIAEQLNSTRRKKVIYGKLYLLYKEKNDLLNALNYHEKYFQYNDSLYQVESAKEIAEIEAKYHQELQTQEIELLKSKNEVNEVQIAKQNIEVITLIFILALMGFGGITLWMRYAEKQKLTKELKEQKKELMLSAQNLQEAQQIVEETNQKLQSANNLLEDKVNNRTKELNQAYEDLLMAHDQLDHFTYRSAHDLRGPIARLLGLCNLAHFELKEKNFSLQLVQDYLDKILQSGKEMDFLLSRILSIYELQQSEIHFTDVNLEQVIQSALKENILEEGILEVTVTDNFSRKVFTDKQHIEKIIKNIIQNSIQYTDTSKQLSYLKILVQQIGSNKICICFKDNGIGVAPEIQNTIFKMFVSGNNDVTKPGLGLYESDLLLDKIGGELILVHSDRNTTEFQVYLPIKHQGFPSQKSFK